MRTLLGFNITQKLFVAVNNLDTNFKEVFPVNTVVQFSTRYDLSNDMVEVARTVGGETLYTNVDAELIHLLLESGELVLVEADELFGGVKFG